MKALIVAVSLLLIDNNLIAQKNFEGKIIYDCSVPGVYKASTEIYFGNQKIKIIETTDSEFKPSVESRMIDFKRGVIYWISDTSKTYYEVLLIKRPFDSITELKPFPEKNKRIMGYNCTAFMLGDSLEATPEMRLPSMHIYMRYADSLFYQVDEKFKNATGIEKATNGTNVGMGMEINIGSDSFMQSIIATPVSIVPGPIPDSVFLVPAGYILKSEKDFFENNVSEKTEVIDIQISEVRKEEAPPPPPPPPPLPAKQINKKKENN